MPTFDVETPNHSLSLEADALAPVPGGWLLSGDQVMVRLPFNPQRMYRHGFHSWSQAAWLNLDQQHRPPVLRQLWPQQDDPVLLEKYPFASNGVIAFETDQGGILLLGALAPDAILEWRSPDVLASCQAHADQADWFLAAGPELDVFNGYAQMLSRRYDARAAARTPRVWCSWYSLYREISETALRNILHDLQGLPFDVFQVDDGWQQHIGHWLPDRQFPSGMDALAGEIRRAGYAPGLWLAPFIAAPTAPVFQEHPDWFIHDAHGEPVPAGENWGGPYFGLDVTHPGAQTWLQETIRRVVGWGFSYLKLDFLFAAALHGLRRQTLPGEQAYRLGMQLVRQAAGPQAYILACGAPVLASLGAADGLRIGPDVAPFWDNYDRTHYLNDPTGPSCRNALSTTLGRLWLKPLIHLDPDVVFFRTRYNLLQPHEKLVLQRMAQACGFLATSDPPAWLDPQETAAMHNFLTDQPEVKRLSYTRFLFDSEEFDFTPCLKDR